MSNFFLGDSKYKIITVPLNYLEPSKEFKIPPKYKLIENLIFDSNLSESMAFFIAEKLIFAVEYYFNKKIDWKKVWFFPDIDNPVLYGVDKETGSHSTLITGSLAIGPYSIVGSTVILNDKNGNKVISLYNDLSNYDLEFNWIPIFPFNEIYFERLFVENNKMRVVFGDITNFKVMTNLTSMPHEGQFGITLWNVNDIEKVSEVLENARSDWNSQTDFARKTGDESLERGYCHNISFNTIDEKVGYWYIDSGSAADGIYEFLLKALSDSGIKIKHIGILEV
jgi:hypothetical protein